MKKKLVAALCIAALAVGIFPANVLAASSASWKVDYTTGAPSGSANPVDQKAIKYSANGFYSNCSSITGSNNRRVTVTANTGGFKNGSTKYITTTGRSAKWQTVNSTTGDVTFRFVASGSTNCSARGTINQYR